MAEQWDQFGPDYDHDPFGGIPKTYLIAASPRSGSHFLGHLLHDTGVLGSPLEYLSPEYARQWMSLLGVPTIAAMLPKLYERRTSPSGWFGIKAHWRQFEPIAARAAAIAFLNFERHIEIRRRDRIAQAISLVMVRQTRSYISFLEGNGEPRYDFAAIHATVAELSDQIHQWGAYFASRNIVPILVEYEDLVADPSATVEQILSAFGLERSDIARAKWIPERQSTDLNARWRDRYLRDLEERAA